MNNKINKPKYAFFIIVPPSPLKLFPHLREFF